MTARAIVLTRAVLPDRVYVRLRTYLVRLMTWTRIIGPVRGVAARDKFWLWVSFLMSPLTSLRSLHIWRDPVLVHDVTADVEGVGLFALRAFTDDLWHVTPIRERAVLACIRDRLRPGDCFVDAGANIGFYSIEAAKMVGITGTVVAIEMMKENVAVLRDNIRMNRCDSMRVVEGAVSANEGEVLMVSMPAGSFGQASLRRTDGETKYKVNSTTFNSVLRDTPSIRLMKMDLEGAELDALKGGGDVLGRIEAIIFEHLDQDSHAHISSLLSAGGFKIEKLDSCNSLALRDAC
ncbi:MAG: FkbM family methyltransferase [Parvibaculum sp.]|nr:FkbM family methyltransferase [Parvibaculum sp.]